MAKKRFYEFKNIANKDSELYVYGEICNGIDKWDETDVTFKDFKDTLENMTQGSTLNMYINSPGGSVFTTQSIIAMLRRAKESGVKINAYIDGLGASCASWLPMIADEVFVYPQSILMIHKPLCGVWGNADEMRKEIEVLDKIENDVIIPLYMEKAKEGVTEDILKEKMSNETWLSSDEIKDLFNVTLLEDERQIACCVDKEVFNKYNNVPEELLKIANKEEGQEEEQAEGGVASTNEEVEDKEKKALEEKVSNLEEVIEKLNKEKEDLVKDKEDTLSKMNDSNEKIIALNEEITKMKPLVDEYNKKLEQEKLEELTNEYEKKFNSLGASKIYKSEEVQNLLKESIKDTSKRNELNSMIVELIQIDNENKNNFKAIDNSATMDNLVPNENNGAIKYGFK